MALYAVDDAVKDLERLLFPGDFCYSDNVSRFICVFYICIH